MKIFKFKPSKKIALVSGIIALSVVGGVAINMSNLKDAGADTSPLVTEVDEQNDKLNNHEARISNLETDTRVLQTNTNTQPSGNKVVVPTVRTANASSSTNTTSSGSAGTLENDSVVVTSYREIVVDPDTSDCEYTYSDGTTHRFAWKTTNQQGSWVTDSSGQNGHWVKSVNRNGICDDRALGQLKN